MNELPKDLIKIFGIPTRTRIYDIREGSILLFFEIILGGITNYKSFYDSIQLARSHCERLLNSALLHEFHDDFDIDVNVEYPNLDIENSFPEHWRGLTKPLTFVQWYQRNVVFHISLTLNIILIIIIGFLVYKAVIKTYFP